MIYPVILTAVLETPELSERDLIVSAGYCWDLCKRILGAEGAAATLCVLESHR